jgi:hypothetical protein
MQGVIKSEDKTKNDHCAECKYINTTAYLAVGKAVCYQKPCPIEKYAGLKAGVEVRPTAIACELFAPMV